MGRHSSPSRRGFKTPVLVISILLVVGLLAWFTVDFLRGRLASAGCDTTTVLNVTAAPDIAPTVTQAARKASEEDKAGCYQINVASHDSAAEAESLVVSDGSERPDVWIPESSMWLQRAQDKGAWSTQANGSSIASSPVVIALADTTATELGWPGRTLAWSELIGPAAKPVSIGFPDPARDPIGVSTLLGLQALTKGAADQTAANVAAMRKLSPNTTAQASDLYARLPGGTSQAEPLSGFPTSENALLRHNVKQDGTPLVAVYPDAGVPSLDYPYTVLPGTLDTKRAAADRFLRRLTSQETSEALADAGFRTPDGIALRDRSQDKRSSALPMSRVPLPKATDVEDVLNFWAAVNLSGRVQVLLDVSGSMNEPVPGTGKNRMDVTLQAAIAGVSLFKPTTKIGWWLFSTKLDGDKDYVELLPMRTVAEQVAAGAVDKLRAVKAVQGGGTGLYDSVLAAYQVARQNWEPGRINTVIIMTDGKNEDPQGISLDQLLSELGKLRDDRRPLKIVGIGVGPGTDPAELDKISKATGGAAFTTQDPSKIGEVFNAALAKMLCQPPICKPGTGS
jgi:ABC-type molybdate transport system substrate-binding protein